MKSTRLLCSMLCVLFLLPMVVSARDAPGEEPRDEAAATLLPEELLAAIAGSWKGTVRTWLKPGELSDESEIIGTIRPLLGTRIFRHRYESALFGKKRRGEETIAFNAVSSRFQISWFDEFHMNYGIMYSEGESTGRGFSVTGKYDAAADAPQWGWETVFEVVDDENIVITAYNVTPAGQKSKAVETVYTRIKGNPEG